MSHKRVKAYVQFKDEHPLNHNESNPSLQLDEPALELPLLDAPSEKKHIAKRARKQNQTLDRHLRNDQSQNEVEPLPETSNHSSIVTIAFPDSIVSNAQSSELRSYFMSQLARIFAMFRVDHVIILRDYSYITKSQQFDATSYIARNLQYLETPQYLRKHLFPIHADLKNVGLMNPIESKHHLKVDEVCPFREGVVVDRPTKGDSSWVEIGLKKQVLINYALQPGTRVSLKLEDPSASQLKGEPVSTDEIRQQGYYWGYSVSIQSKFHKLLSNTTYDTKVLIQSDNRDRTDSQSVKKLDRSLRHNQNLLVVFSGFDPITNFAENDEKSKLTGEEIYKHFDIIYRFDSENFGVKQLRLEEQMFMFLQKLRF